MMMALLSLTFLALAGFYVVKDAVTRDRRTRVGQIVATTPIRKAEYLLGKWLSNVSVLGLVLLILMVVAPIMQLVRGEVLAIHFGQLYAPLLLTALPFLTAVAALAVLFECVPFLSGGFGNVVYFFLWVFSLPLVFPVDMHAAPAVDPLGTRAPVISMQEAHDRQLGNGDAEFGVGYAVFENQAYQTFEWDGYDWSSHSPLQSLMAPAAGLLFVLVSAVFFTRFDPARRKHPDRQNGLVKRWLERLLPERNGQQTWEENRAGQLSSLDTARHSFRPGAILLAEVKLLLKGQCWWWYAGALGVLIAGLTTPLADARQVVLPLAWIWPLLIWSQIGIRESRYRTRSLVFSAPQPVVRQLPATWLAGVLVAALMGSTVGVRLALGGQWLYVGGWLVGLAFIPSLALGLGVWSGSSRLFEAIYLVLWYGVLNQVPFMDFMGTTALSHQMGVPLVYAGLSLVLLVFAALGRKRQTFVTQ
jgi:hypothetical protein